MNMIMISMWNDIIGGDVKHLEKVLPITPWTLLYSSCENSMTDEKGNKEWDESWTDINIGAEGAAKISESLMTNTTLTILDLGSDDNIIKNKQE